MFKTSIKLLAKTTTESKKDLEFAFNCEKAKKEIEKLNISYYNTRKVRQSCKVSEETGILFSEKRCQEIQDAEMLRAADLAQAYKRILKYCKNDDLEMKKK